jgi:hypothetical protein
MTRACGPQLALRACVFIERRCRIPPRAAFVPADDTSRQHFHGEIRRGVQTPGDRRHLDDLNDDAMHRGAVAQLGERRFCKPEVVGSIPISSIRVADFSSLNA